MARRRRYLPERPKTFKEELAETIFKCGCFVLFAGGCVICIVSRELAIVLIFAFFVIGAIFAVCYKIFELFSLYRKEKKEKEEKEETCK